MSKNDDKILELKKKIEEKKAAIGAEKRFSPRTSCSLEMNGTRCNLHAADKETLALLLCQLHPVNRAAEELGLSDSCKIGGFPINDWCQDIYDKLSLLSQKAELAKLKVMESQLDKLLSEDKKTELELASIAASLNI